MCVEHLNSCVATTKNLSACATVVSKLKKLVEAKVLLRAAFFTDILAEAKRLSLITQEKNFKVIKMLNAVHELRESVKKDKRKLKAENCD